MSDVRRVKEIFYSMGNPSFLSVRPVIGGYKYFLCQFPGLLQHDQLISVQCTVKQISPLPVFPYKRKQRGYAYPASNRDKVSIRPRVAVPQGSDDLEHIAFPELRKRQGPFSPYAVKKTQTVFLDTVNTERSFKKGIIGGACLQHI